MPPPWMWPHDKELESWFDEVERAREEKYGLSSGDKNDDDDDGGGSSMMSNELARGRR